MNWLAIFQTTNPHQNHELPQRNECDKDPPNQIV